MIAAPSGIVSLEQAQRLKALGFPQNYRPQKVWVYDGAIGPDDVHTLDQQTDWSDIYLDCNWCAAPFLLSDDPERPGVVEWLESRDWVFVWSSVDTWFASSAAAQNLPAVRLDAHYLTTLIDLILDVMEAKR